MTDPWILYPLLISSALIAGIMNSVAGGGTLLTFPALTAVLVGPEAAVIANATSTVALLPGSLAGTWGYRRELAEVMSIAKKLLPVSLLGGWVGSELLVRFPKQFAALVPWLILTAAILFLLQPVVAKFLKKSGSAEADQPGWFKLIVLQVFQFLVAVYGGYFGAGIGILMLTALGFLSLGSIHRMNAVKTLLAASINGITVIVCIRDNKIHWHYAGVMAVAAILGGYLGARVARQLPAWMVRWTVIAIGFSLAVAAFANRPPG